MTTLVEHRGTENGVHYGEPVNDSTHAEDARAAIKRIAAAEASMASARAARDHAVVRMFQEDGMTAPQIARATAMSESNVRLILKMARGLPEEQ